ncbi:sulfatase [Nocardioides taihuensis]|uniref:Sulfatase n=1 Tax=Nocardioides taihuensis TaxID=1835606 RepID=A0ABW0BDX7_9ACTN
MLSHAHRVRAGVTAAVARVTSRVVVPTVALALALSLPSGAVLPPSGASAAVTPPPAAARGTDARPNILLITSDDQRDDEMPWMPFTRRLIGRTGVDVTDFISPHPLCCPARAEIFTGEYAHNNGVRHNGGPYGGWQAFVDAGNSDEHLGVWLQDAGYRTAFVGKMLNGYDRSAAVLPGFDHWNPTVAAPYAYYGTTFFDDGQPRQYRDDYVADVAADYAHDYIREFSAQQAPWFLWISHVGPHDAHRNGVDRAPIPAERHADLFPDEVPPSLARDSFNEPDTGDKPSEVRTGKVRKRAITAEFRARIRSLQAIDEANRAAVRQLRRLGELDDTIIVYTSDNGYLLGEHRLTGKNVPYEEALQVPFLVRGPGLPRGEELDERLTMVDVAPTFLHAAGVLADVRAAGHTDGIDMWPVLTGRRSAPSTHLTQAGTSSPEVQAAFGWWWRGVTTDRWSYTRWWTGETELYDRSADPLQLDNLADDPTYRSVRRELQDRLDVLGSCAGPAACNQDLGAEPQP